MIGKTLISRENNGVGALSLKYINLREIPDIKEEAAEWFHSKWGVPKEAYLECMENYLNNETEFGWYLCLDEDRIAGGLGVIDNDFHERKDCHQIYVLYTRKKNIVVKESQGSFLIWL